MKAVLFSLLLVFSCLAQAGGQWVGKPAPALKLPDQDGRLRTIAEFRGRWVALYFYPRDRTPGCTEEAKRFRERWVDFQKAGISVLGVSVDDVASHKDFASRLQLPYPLLADEKHELAEAMGVLKGIGPLSYASRENFLIDPESTVVYHYSSVDTRQHAEQVLGDVRRLSAASPSRR